MSGSLADFSISAESLQYLKVPVSGTVNGSVVNPTTDVVSFAFPAPGSAPSVWTTGSWETISGIYYARILVGPSPGLTLAKGLYEVYVKVTDNPEAPVLNSGLLELLA